MQRGQSAQRCRRARRWRPARARPRRSAAGPGRAARATRSPRLTSTAATVARSTPAGCEVAMDACATRHLGVPAGPGAPAEVVKQRGHRLADREPGHPGAQCPHPARDLDGPGERVGSRSRPGGTAVHETDAGVLDVHRQFARARGGFRYVGSAAVLRRTRCLTIPPAFPSSRVVRNPGGQPLRAGGHSHRVVSLPRDGWGGTVGALPLRWAQVPRPFPALRHCLWEIV